MHHTHRAVSAGVRDQMALENQPERFSWLIVNCDKILSWGKKKKETSPKMEYPRYMQAVRNPFLHIYS